MLEFEILHVYNFSCKQKVFSGKFSHHTSDIERISIFQKNVILAYFNKETKIKCTSPFQAGFSLCPCP